MLYISACYESIIDLNIYFLCSVSKVDAALSLVESFTHARTILSSNASFARLLYTLQFDSFGLITGLSIQVRFDH